MSALAFSELALFAASSQASLCAASVYADGSFAETMLYALPPTASVARASSPKSLTFFIIKKSFHIFVTFIVKLMNNKVKRFQLFFVFLENITNKKNCQQKPLYFVI